MKRVPSDYQEIFERGVEDIVTRAELDALLRGGKKIRIKHGIDVTAPGLHIGHAASLWKIRALQENGHCAVILLGDVTTTIGDPTGKSKARPILSEKEIVSNAKAIEKETRTILLGGKEYLEVHRSSEWYKKMTVPQFISVLSNLTYARLIERDMFRERIRSGGEIFLNEMLYPVLQGYDSVMLKSDLTIIGFDQLFNEHVGRLLQERMGQSPQVIAALKILPGLDGGPKMSKSQGNYIGISDSPEDKFGKAMRVIDSLIIPYLTIYTDVAQEEIVEIERKLSVEENPMKAKLFFAEALVRRYHGPRVAGTERERFLSRFSRKEIPKDNPSLVLSRVPKDILELLCASELARSRSEARHLIAQGAVEIDSVVVRTHEKKFPIDKAFLLKVGKRKLLRVTMAAYAKNP